MLCRNDYYERVVATFSHQIKSEYYGENLYMSIEGIVLEHFSALPQTEIKSSTKLCPQHAVFRYFFSGDNKQAALLQLHTEYF